MRRLMISICVVGLLLSASTAMALPLGGPLYNSVETFDDYTVSPPDDTNYAANWSGTRPPVTTPSPFSAENCVTIGPEATQYRASYDLVPDIQAIDASKTAVNGTDVNPLVQSFNLDINTVGTQRKYSSFFIEMSMGDVASPAYPYWTETSPVLPVLAFGWTYGHVTAANAPYFFNGAYWTNITADGMIGLNSLVAAIKTDAIEFDNTRDGFGVDVIPRFYKGGFDTITMRSTGNISLARRADDIALGGGELVPEPATLMLLGLGGLLLRRRR